jgi:hypothetical protein
MDEFLDYMVKNKELNMKCVYISGGAVAAHYFLPKNIPSYLLIGFSSYILLSYYDAYNYCDLKLSANTILHPLTASLKPPVDSKGKYSFDG